MFERLASQHYAGLIDVPLRTLRPLQYYRIEGYKGTLNQSPIMPKDASLSDSKCIILPVSFFQNILRLSNVHFSKKELGIFLESVNKRKRTKSAVEQSFCHKRISSAKNAWRYKTLFRSAKFLSQVHKKLCRSYNLSTISGSSESIYTIFLQLNETNLLNYGNLVSR